MVRNRSLFALALAAAMVVVTPAVAAAADAHPAGDPKALIRGKYDKIHEIIKATEDEQKMREQIRKEMDLFVDFDLFGKLALKRHWDELGPDQQKEYLDLFKKLIQRTYLKRFKANKPFSVGLDQPVRFNSSRTKALVDTVVTSGKTSADVDYKMYVPDENKRWLVYDVVVDEVSYMRNYRNSFEKTWQKGGYDLLVEKMRKKADKPVSDDEEEDDDFF
jgi:phospholipid transport system substrate-binding protein